MDNEGSLSVDNHMKSHKGPVMRGHNGWIMKGHNVVS